MSRTAQIVVAVVWIVVLLVFWVDAEQYVHSRPWLPEAIPYDFGVGVAATVMTVAADQFLRRRRR
jgi:hypothetical protein